MRAESFPGFEIVEQIQESSKSVIWLARQHSLDRMVMLKLLRPEAAARPAELARFLLTARTLSRLKADGLAQIYDVVSEGERHYIVMESVDGPTLMDLVGQKGCLPVMQAARIAFAVAEALGQAWDAGRLVHRNLKPTGIRLDSRGIAKMVDFGQAAIIVPDREIADPDDGHIVGTPNFLSPEQCAAEKHLDCRADMYALGAVLYYVLTGHIPFSELPAEAVIQMQIYGQLPHPHRFRADLPAPACGLIERLTMKHPDDRYATWTEVMGDIQHLLKSMPLRRRETVPKGTATLAPDLPSATPANTLQRAAPAVAPDPPAAHPAVPPASVAPPPKTAPPSKTAPAARPPVTSLHPSSFSRVILWLMLGCWFAVLANDRMGDPLRLGFELQSATGAIRGWLGLSPSAADQPRIATPPQPVHRPAPPPPAALPATLPRPIPGPVAGPAVSAPQPPRTPQTDSAALSPDLVGRLSVAFSRGDLDAARAILLNTPATSAVLAARDLLNEVPDINRLTEDGIMRMRGQEISIEFNNIQRMVIPQRVVNGRIFVMIAADRRMVDFETDRLSPRERLRWAGPLDTPAKKIAACVMMLKANDTVFVAENAGACGILAPAFEMAIAR